VGSVLAAGALAPAVLLVIGGEFLAANSALIYLVAHAILFLGGLFLARRSLGLPLRVGAVLCAVGGLGALLPALAGAPRLGLIYVHVAAGAATAAVLLRATLRGASTRRRRRWLAVVPLVAAGLLLSAYAYRERVRADWQPPRYNSEACYRFLTATTEEQSGEPLFPSALRVFAASGRGCQDGGCHAEVHQRASSHAHATAGSTPAYTRTLADFVQRRGTEAGRWCRGCHSPEDAPEFATAVAALGATAVQASPKSVPKGVSCTSCHHVDAVHALYGSAALRLRGGPAPETRPWQVLLRPKEHAAQNLRPSLHRSAELCGACHRKNWNLPQNGFHWQPGPDEQGQWQTSRYAPSSLFAAGERARPRGCQSCHDAHATPPRTPAGRASALDLALFLRRGPAGRLVDRIADAPPPRPGEPLLLDVVVRNTGIGHDFPTGMPDLQESWLEVTLLDRAGRARFSSGQTASGAPLAASSHVYRLVARDRATRPVLHGNLDEMVSVAEWRRIPAGGADVARFAFQAPPEGVGTVRVRLLRRRRPDFSRWVGEALQREPDVLAQVESSSPEANSEAPARVVADAEQWRSYGAALAGVKAYPEALQALARAQQARPGEVETLVALGRVYLDDGDLLAAREQFRQAGPGDPDRARAWEGAVLRRMGQGDQAATLLEPLVRRFPRDLRLRFELGSAYLAALRNADAAHQFEAMLDVDPIDVSAHYNLMLCLQRLNRLTDARREETIYRLLRQEPTRAPEAVTSLEDRPLHLHPLEPKK
jgi:tetratricopeptide (TPR) repeat protein